MEEVGALIQYLLLLRGFFDLKNIAYSANISRINPRERGRLRDDINIQS